MVVFIGGLTGRLVGPVVIKKVEQELLIAGTVKAVEIGATKLANKIGQEKGGE